MIVYMNVCSAIGFVVNLVIKMLASAIKKII